MVVVFIDLVEFGKPFSLEGKGEFLSFWLLTGHKFLIFFFLIKFCNRKQIHPASLCPHWDGAQEVKENQVLELMGTAAKGWKSTVSFMETLKW